MTHRRLALSLLVAAVCACPCMGDKVITKKGQTHEGKIVAETETSVRLRLSKYGGSTIIEIPRDQVQAIVRGPGQKKLAVPARPAKPRGPTCFVVPVEGPFGLLATAPLLRQCLNLARAKKPTVVVLNVYSGGGSVAELERMIEVLAEYKDLRIVAYVRQAGSAAAILSMACREIIMAPRGAIGAAVVIVKTPKGIPANVAEKFQSFHRAQFRAIAKAAGHSPLLVDGMMRTDIVLTVRGRGGNAKIISGPGGRLLKGKGRILSLAADEAVSCGLALGVSPSIEQAHRHLGLPRCKVLHGEGHQLWMGWLRKLQLARQQFDVAASEADDLITKALASDPGKFTYTVDRYTRRFTPASRREWEKRSKKCARHCQAAGAKLRRAAGLAARYPYLELPVAELRDYENRLAAFRQAVEADKRRRGIP